MKVGDKVRLLRDIRLGQVGFWCDKGAIVTITAIRIVCGETYYRFDGATSDYTRDVFEPIPAEVMKTDEELAAEWREAYERQVELRRQIEERGYILQAMHNVPVSSHWFAANPSRKWSYRFHKTTTTEIIL